MTEATGEDAMGEEGRAGENSDEAVDRNSNKTVQSHSASASDIAGSTKGDRKLAGAEAGKIDATIPRTNGVRK